MKKQQYVGLNPTWPATGRHILASFDDVSITVYQAFRPAIANHAVLHQQFGGEFSYSRMSWIKPNFLWMMYRAGWATKPGQERILAVRLQRGFFDELLRQAVPSSFDPLRHDSREAWSCAVRDSDVRLQWDPDHDPAGRPLTRRAIQLGLRGEALRAYGTTALLSIDDITDDVAEQRARVHDSGQLMLPAERVYVAPEDAARNIGLDDAPELARGD